MKNEDINLNHLNEQGSGQIVFSPQNGKPGYRVKKPDGSLGQWIPVSPSDYNKPGLKADIDRYVKSGGKVYTPPKPKPKPDSRLDSPIAGKGPKGNEVGSKPSTRPAAQPPAAPAPTPAPSGSGGGGGGSAPRPAPAPAPAAPKPSPVADYMKAAAAARKSGDPAEMAKVRDMGMDIWRKSNPKLAAAADERARIRGTSQTDNPLMKDMKSRLPLTPSVQAPEVKNLGSGQQSLAQNPNAAVAAAPKMPELKVSTDKEMAKTSDSLSKNPLPKKEVKKEAYDVVLDYILSEGHADTLSEAHYVMLQMDADHIQNIIQERAWWDPAGLFMSKREREVEKAKSTSTGAGGSYNPNTGRTYNPTAKDQSRATGVIAPRGGIVGTMEPGKPSTWQRYAPGSDAFRRQNIDRYVTVRGRDQLQLDDLKNRAMKDKAKRDAAATAAFDKKYGVNEPPGDEFAGARKNTRVIAQPQPTAAPRTTSRPAATAPAASKPKPKPPTIQSKNVTATGTSYERRTPTSAELAASRAAGGGEAGIKAAVDVAKTNKVAATSPTPDLKPEAPKKQSLADTVKELQGMRKAAEERNK